MVVTEEILNKGLSSRGGWSERQLRVLGVEGTAFNKGWKSRLIGSEVPDENVALFLMLKDKHLKKDADQGFLFGERPETEVFFTGGHKYNCGTCHHGTQRNCTDKAEDNCCGHWYSPGNTVKGIEYGRIAV